MGMMLCCGMAVTKMAMLGMSARRIKTLTVKIEAVTLIGKGRQNVTCIVYVVYEINNKIFFLSRHFILVVSF